PPAPSRGSTRSTRRRDHLRARHRLGCDRERAALPPLGAPRVRRRSRSLSDGARRRARRALQRRPARLPRVGALARAGGSPVKRPTSPPTSKEHAMKRFSPRLFALGLALGALGAAAVLTAGAYAHGVRAKESGRPVIDWNQALLSIVNTPGAQPANIQPTRNFAILHAATYDAVNTIDRTHEPYLVSVRAPRDASETAAADAAAHTVLLGLYPAQQTAVD